MLPKSQCTESFFGAPEMVDQQHSRARRARLCPQQAPAPPSAKMHKRRPAPTPLVAPSRMSAELSQAHTPLHTSIARTCSLSSRGLMAHLLVSAEAVGHSNTAVCSPLQLTQRQISKPGRLTVRPDRASSSSGEPQRLALPVAPPPASTSPSGGGNTAPPASLSGLELPGIYNLFHQKACH